MTAALCLLAAFVGAYLGGLMVVWMVLRGTLKAMRDEPKIEFRETLDEPVTSSKTGAKVWRDWEYRKSG